MKYLPIRYPRIQKRRLSLITLGALIGTSMLLGGCIDDQKSDVAADLTLEILDISFEEKDGRMVFNHTRKFTESAGVDLTITRGKICVESRQTCVDAYVSYEVEAAGTLVQKNHHVATRLGNDAITFEYWAKDENGFEHKLIQTMLVDGQTATIKKQQP